MLGPGLGLEVSDGGSSDLAWDGLRAKPSRGLRLAKIERAGSGTVALAGARKGQMRQRLKALEGGVQHRSSQMLFHMLHLRAAGWAFVLFRIKPSQRQF